MSAKIHWICVCLCLINEQTLNYGLEICLNCIFLANVATKHLTLPVSHTVIFQHLLRHGQLLEGRGATSLSPEALMAHYQPFRPQHRQVLLWPQHTSHHPATRITAWDNVGKSSDSQWRQLVAPFCWSTACVGVRFAGRHFVPIHGFQNSILISVHDCRDHCNSNLNWKTRTVFTW